MSSEVCGCGGAVQHAFSQAVSSSAEPESEHSHLANYTSTLLTIYVLWAGSSGTFAVLLSSISSVHEPGPYFVALLSRLGFAELVQLHKF